MKRKISVILLLTILLLIMTGPISSTLAQSPTVTPPPSKASTPSATPSDIINKLKQIQILKEKIATKVAEIREKEKKAISGVVKSIDQSTLVISKNGQDLVASISEDTLYYSFTKEGKNETTSKSVKIGSLISIFGYTGEGANKLAAKYIYNQTSPIFIVGKIADIDKEKFTITVRERQENQLVDIETYTKNFVFTRERGRQKIGFSKLKIGDTVHIIGTANTKEENRVTAVSILVLSFTPQ